MGNTTIAERLGNAYLYDDMQTPRHGVTHRKLCCGLGTSCFGRRGLTRTYNTRSADLDLAPGVPDKLASSACHDRRVHPHWPVPQAHAKLLNLFLLPSDHHCRVSINETIESQIQEAL